MGDMALVRQFVCYAAARALWSIDRDVDLVVPALIRILGENIHFARPIELLGEIGSACGACKNSELPRLQAVPCSGRPARFRTRKAGFSSLESPRMKPIKCMAK
jgi:hypothetical protein